MATEEGRGNIAIEDTKVSGSWFPQSESMFFCDEDPLKF